MSRSGRAVVAPLAVASALRGICASVLMTFLPVYAVLTGMRLPEVGTVSAIAMGVSVALIPLAGFAADLLGRKVVLLISTATLAAAPLAPFLIKEYWGVLASYILFNSAINIWIPARAAAVAGSVGRSAMGTSFAVLSLSFQVSRVATPYAAGILIKNYGYAPVFTAASVIAASAAVIITVFVPEQRSEEKFSLSSFFKGVIPRREELWFHTFLCIDRSAWRLWMPILNSYMKANLGFGEDVIGFVNSFRGLASMLGVMPSGRLVDKYGWVPALLASEVAGALGALTVVFADSPEVMVLALSLIGLSVALWAPSFNVAVPSIVPVKSELGRTYARSNFYRSVAAVPAPWLGGLLYNITPVLPMATGAILLFMNLAVLAALAKKS